MNLDFEHILQELKCDVLDPRIIAKYLYFNDESYYSCVDETHFMNLQFSKGISYYIVFWGGPKRASITKSYVSDTFDEDTREIFKLFDMYSTEEEHFMESTVRDVQVPFEVMEEIRNLCTKLKGMFYELQP